MLQSKHFFTDYNLQNSKSYIVKLPILLKSALWDKIIKIEWNSGILINFFPMDCNHQYFCVRYQFSYGAPVQLGVFALNSSNRCISSSVSCHPRDPTASSTCDLLFAPTMGRTSLHRVQFIATWGNVFPPWSSPIFFMAWRRGWTASKSSGDTVFFLPPGGGFSGVYFPFRTHSLQCRESETANSNIDVCDKHQVVYVESQVPMTALDAL